MRSAAIGFAIALAATASGAMRGELIGEARAGSCDHGCGEHDGDVCAALPSVVAAGAVSQLYVSVQQGTCGGSAPMPLSELSATWSRAATGPFTPMPLRPGGEAYAVASASFLEPGVYFLAFAARSGKGAVAHQVVLALPPVDSGDPTAPVEVIFRLRPPRGLSLSKLGLASVRYVPVDGSESSAFPEATWPQWRDNEAAGASAKPLSLPLGRYQLRWKHWSSARTVTGFKLVQGVELVEVTGAGELAVPLHPMKPAKAAKSTTPARSAR